MKKNIFLNKEKKECLNQDQNRMIIYYLLFSFCRNCMSIWFPLEVVSDGDGWGEEPVHDLSL